jgi:hypothetical protein
MQYYQFVTAGVAISDIMSFYRQDTFEHNMLRYEQGQLLKEEVIDKPISSFLITPSHWKTVNNSYVQLEPPIITDVANKGTLNYDMRSICFNEKAKSVIEPYLHSHCRVLHLTAFFNEETGEPIDTEYFLVLVRYFDISEHINFEQSTFMSMIRNDVRTKELLPNFNEKDYQNWVNKQIERAKNPLKTVFEPEQRGVFIEKLVLKTATLHFFVLPYFFNHWSVIVSSEIIEKMREANLTGLEIEEVNICI